MLLRRSVWLCAVGLFAVVAPAGARDLEKFLPDDTEMVVSFNIRQILESDFYKKNVGDAGRDLLKSSTEAQDLLKESDLGAGQRKMRIGVCPWSDKTLARHL